MEQEYAEEMGAQADMFGGEDGAKRRAGAACSSCASDLQLLWLAGRGAALGLSRCQQENSAAASAICCVDADVLSGE